MKNGLVIQAVKFVKKFANNVVEVTAWIQDYFKNGSFGVAVYPFLMHPCVRRSNRVFLILIATLASFCGVYYLFAELVTSLFSEATFGAYFKYTILELMNSSNAEFSPLAYVLQSVFNLQAIAFWLIYLVMTVQISRHKYWLLSIPLALFFTIGMSLIPHSQGKITDGGLQNLGASITYLIGNLAVLFAGIDLTQPHLRFIRRYSLFAGLIGVICISTTLFMPNVLSPILERVGIYTIIIWEILLGFALLKRKEKTHLTLPN